MKHKKYTQTLPLITHLQLLMTLRTLHLLMLLLLLLLLLLVMSMTNMPISSSIEQITPVCDICIVYSDERQINTPKHFLSIWSASCHLQLLGKIQGQGRD
jgi:hypothetical protein